MSIKWINVGWSSTHVNLKHPTQLLVYLALADFSNDEGVSWPLVKTIAAKARTSERNVSRIIAQFESAGMVERQDRWHDSTVWTLTDPAKWTANLAPQDDDGVTDEASWGALGGGQNRQEPSTPSTNSVVDEVVNSPGCERSQLEPWKTARGHDLPRSWTPSDEYLRRAWTYLKVWGLYEYVDHYLLRLRAIGNGKAKPSNEQFLSWLIKDERDAQSKERLDRDRGQSETSDDGTPLSWKN